MPAPTRACRCGAAILPDRTCSHCDRPRTCAAYERNGGCEHCRHRDSWCLICREWRQTPTNAQACESRHRQQERAAKA